MNWFYAEGDRQCGPVSDEQLGELARTGKLQPNTLVWREGMANWQAFNSVQGHGQAAVLESPPVIATNTAACAECGRSFLLNDMVRIQNAWLCAACKPIFLQRLQEGAPPPVSIGVWRSEKLLVAGKGTVFPDRCVKCNAPTSPSRRLKRTLYWYPSYVIIIILLSLLIGLIVAMIVRKTTKVEIGLCEEHWSKRVRNMVLGGFLGLGGFALLVAGLMNSWGVAALAGIVALIFGVILMVRATVIAAKKMDDKFVWVKGVCQPYLDSLPEWR